LGFQRGWCFLGEILVKALGPFFWVEFLWRGASSDQLKIAFSAVIMPMIESRLTTLKLTEPFRIAHGASAERLVLRVSGEADGIQAFGEAPFVPYYHDDPTEILRWLSERAALDFRHPPPSDAPRLVQLALELLRGDWMGKKHGVTLSEELGELRAPSTDSILGCRSFSIPTDMSRFADLVKQTAAQFKVLKLKLGSGDLAWDEQIVEVARAAAPEVVLFADVNGGWSVEQSIQMIRRLERWNLAFIEQPIHHQNGVAGWRSLREKLGVTATKLVADESAQTFDDLDALLGLADGVNVKMLKCGGWSKAAQMMKRQKQTAFS
jgi:L-alanine-DL-glutamate epimerase-like enolase superfamily enzyme